MTIPILGEKVERDEQPMKEALDVELSSSTGKIDDLFYVLLYSIVSSFKTRMGKGIDEFAFQADAETYLHCEVQDVNDIYAHIRCLRWYDVQNVAHKRLIEKYGSDLDQQRLQEFEEHRDKYFMNQNRLRMVPSSHELYRQFCLDPETGTLFLFLIDPRWDQICSNLWLPGICNHITKLIMKQSNIRQSSVCFCTYVNFCTVAKAS